MLLPARGALPLKPYLATLALGGAFALIVSSLWSLELRWGVIVALAILSLGACMCFARIFMDFLLIGSIAALPVLSFGKWFWLESLTSDERGNVVYSGTFGIGPLDVLLVMQYSNWFYRAFVLGIRMKSRWTMVDFFALWFIVANVISAFGAPSPLYSVGVIIFLLKYLAFYFYISRHIETRHLPWIIAAFGTTLAMEALLGVYQALSGKLLGVALDKGAGGQELDYQYLVPGTEGKHRATGTCYDSHSFGLFIGMILPFMLVLMLTLWIKPIYRMIFAVGAGVALLLVFLSLSRSSWVAIAIALTLGVIMMLVHWRERYLLAKLGFVGLLLAVTSPFTIPPIYERFVNSPYETLSTRFDQYIFGLHIWRDNFFLGYGPGNWLIALRERDFLWLEILLVHNVILLTAAETGVVGAIGFLGTVGAAMWRLYSAVRFRSDLVGRYALAALVALMTSIGAGMTDPTLREPNTFGLYWLMLALSVSLPGMPEITKGVFVNSAKFRAQHRN